MWLLLVILAIAVIVGLLFNQLIRCRFLMKEAQSGIEVQFKRRHDLIPNIVETVKGYMQYEQKLLEDITSIRSKVLNFKDNESKQKLENSLSLGLKNIFALAENYPDLKANKSFLELHQALVEVEDQLQMARRYYNGTVRNYNIAVESFPGNIIASFFGFKPAEFFEIEYATERQAPDIRFQG